MGYQTVGSTFGVIIYTSYELQKNIRFSLRHPVIAAILVNKDEYIKWRQQMTPTLTTEVVV